MSYTWEQIQQILAAEISGEEPRPMMSKRTLFGIPSTIEVMMEDAAKEATQKRAEEIAKKAEEEKLKQEQENLGDPSCVERETELQTSVDAIQPEDSDKNGIKVDAFEPAEDNE